MESLGDWRGSDVLLHLPLIEPGHPKIDGPSAVMLTEGYFKCTLGFGCHKGCLTLEYYRLSSDADRWIFCFSALARNERFGMRFMVQDSSPQRPPRRPQMQFSLQTLLVLTGLLACGLAAWRMSGPQLLSQYFLLIYGAGPWFAYLVGECLPTPVRLIRVVFANGLLIAMFLIGLKMWENWFGWPAVFYATAITGLVWTPQYLAFFHRRAAGI